MSGTAQPARTVSFAPAAVTTPPSDIVIEAASVHDPIRTTFETRRILKDVSSALGNSSYTHLTTSRCLELSGA